MIKYSTNANSFSLSPQSGHFPFLCTQKWQRIVFCNIYLIAILLISITCFLINIHCLNSLRQGGDGEVEFWMTVDSAAYFSGAAAIASGGRIITVFRERLLLPLLLHWTGSTPQNPYCYLYSMQILHFFFPLFLARISRVLFKRRVAAVGSAGLYLAYSLSGNASRVVMTDFPHAFCFTVALYFTLIFLRTRRTGNLIPAVLCWMLTMLVRPTFMGAWFLFLPVLVGSWLFGRMPFGKVLVFWLSLMLVPTWFIFDNYNDYGVAVNSFASFENIHTALVPGIKTLLRKQAGDTERISVIFMDQERNQKAMRGTEYLKLGMWKDTLPSDKRVFQETFHRLGNEDRAFLLKNVSMLYVMIKEELGELVLQARGRWLIGERGHPLFVWAALLGLMLLWCDYRQRGAALLLFLCCGVVFVPAAFGLQLWWGVRTALPADLVFIVLAGSILVSWRRLIMVVTLCMAFKILNMFCYDPTFNCAVVCLLAFFGMEVVGLYLKRTGHYPKSVSFTGRRYGTI